MAVKSDFFEVDQFLTPPTQRPAYSDRMAYVLGEMSALAYFPYEGVDRMVGDAVKTIRDFIAGHRKDEEIQAYLEEFTEKLYHSKDSNLDIFKKVLKAAGFDYIDHFDKGTTQGFLCRKEAPGEPPYLVLAFRGTEKKLDDWLTDARARPQLDPDPDPVTGTKNNYRVHSGFYEAFGLVKRDIMAALKKDACLDGEGHRLPLYVTGHSLGGALALLMTRYLNHDGRGACYTYGAPRVANYEFFLDIKTPVYRVVNSSDIVPRVPLGASNQIVVGLLRGLSWLTASLPPVGAFFKWLEHEVDKLNGYRHYGDLRYLTDVQGGRFEEVKLVFNPPALDRLQWFLRHLKASFFTPVKSHSCDLYRRKLVEVARYRNKGNSVVTDGSAATD